MSEETKQLRLVLNLTVDYELNGTDPEELRQNLATIVQRTHSAGMITGDSTAAIDEIDWHVEGRDRPRVHANWNCPAALISWLQRLPDDAYVYIDDDGIRLTAVGGEKVYYLELGGHTPEDDEVDFEQWDDEVYDVEAMRGDYRNGNLDTDDPSYAERYRHASILRDSFVNGQFTQAKRICEDCGFNYELELYKFEQSENQ